MFEHTAPRVVPGAPPPAPLSKTQKKRRKAKAKGPEATADSSVVAPDTISAAVSEKGVDVNDAQEPAQVPEPNTQPESDAAPAPDDEPFVKLSPIVDLIHKRLKVTTKKINRIVIYAATEPDKLNDDQKRTLKTLPTLEAIQKELGEVKRAVEAHEADLAQGLAAKRAETEKAEKERIVDAVAAAERSVSGKVYDILNFVRVRVAANSGEIPPTSLETVQGAVVLQVADVLLGMNQNLKQNIVQGIVKGSGNFEGVAYATLIETVQELLQASGVPAPVNGTNGVTVSVPVPPSTGSFHFMQASELDAPSHEANTEWVEQPEHPVIQAAAEPAANGHDHQGVATHNDQIDWSEDHGGLPSVASLHAKFGTSGEVTPVEESQPQETESPASSVDPKKGPKEDEDGFTQYRSGRGRSRGHPRGGRGYHRGGGERGGFRGGDRNHRGGYRGGDRGGYRGRGEWRGDGEHRSRGEWRGDGEHKSRAEWRGDGEHRNRAEWRGDGEHRNRGEWRGDGEHRSRGEWRSDGEHRGRGRGRGRGGHRGGGDRVSDVPTPAPAPPAATAA